jgi:hypothetical protein
MPELDFIYSDRDRATLEGKRSNPLFKPDWSPDVMLSVNYLAMLSHKPRNSTLEIQSELDLT